MGAEEETELGQLLPSDAQAPDEEVEIALREEALRRAVAELPQPEQNVVRLRYGINGDQPTPRAEVSRRLDMPERELRRVEERALARLAERARSRVARGRLSLIRADRPPLESFAMKAEIHPDYVLSHVRCSCKRVLHPLDQPELHVELCSACHPFYTGKQKLVDTGGRVERFKRRAARRARG